MTNPTKPIYIHDEIGHNLNAPSEIVPIIYEIFKPQSVIDVGCGLGTFLKVFKDLGVKKVVGLDGDWTNRELLKKNINLDDFQVADLSKKIASYQKFDLAISLEVAEHLKEDDANVYLDNLTDLSDVIIFSAAIPFQGGLNHLNEQWVNYWESKFAERGFKMLDLFKNLFWNNDLVDFWYKQNLYLVIKGNISFDINQLKKYRNTSLMNAVHPELYLKKAQLLETIINGKMNYLFYIKLIYKKLFKRNR